MHLVTKRLILREFIENDWQAVLAYQRDSRYLQFYEWTERSEDDVRAFVRRFIEQQEELPRTKFQLAITLKTDGALIGNCGIRRNKPGDRVAEIGYELAPKHWKQGYATEAAHAIIAFGFEQLGLHRIEALCHAENAASAHVLEKLGMRLEARLHERELIKGHWADTLLYGILDREWLKR